MKSMKLLIAVYSVILLLGISSLITKVHYFANIAGFIAAIGFLLVFFKDTGDNETEAEQAETRKYKRYWYIVFGTGIFFSILFGSFWNDQMGNMI